MVYTNYGGLAANGAAAVRSKKSCTPENDNIIYSIGAA